MEKIMTAENVDVARLMHAEGAKDVVAKVEEYLAADPVATKLMQVAETVEDVFEVVKKCVKITLAEFKIIFDKTVNYFKEEKTALPDEVMDGVVGGGWWSDFWNNNRHAIVCTSIMVGCAVAGAVVGGIIGGGPGALALGLIGLGIGGVLAGVYTGYTEGWD